VRACVRVVCVVQKSHFGINLHRARRTFCPMYRATH